MRIAILGSRGIPARHGGFESFAEGLATRLVERGHVVTVYCEGRRGERPRTYRGVDLVHVPVPPIGCLRPLAYDFAALAHASLGHDVVYLLGYGAAVFGVVPRALGRTLWINMDGLEWRRAKWSGAARRWFRWMERVALKLADLVVFDAAAIRDDLVGRHGPPRAGVVLPYAATPRLGSARPEVLARHGLTQGGYHLVVCRLEPENHVLEIVRGHAAAGSDHPLVLVTERTEGSAYADACREASGASTRWLGPVWDRDELESLRCGALSYLHGHSVGGTNPSLLEAMACGNLCVAHDNPFTREVLGEHGLFFTDEDDFARVLRQAEALPPRSRRQLGADARARVVRDYDWELLVDGYEAALREHAPAWGDVAAEPAAGSAWSVPTAPTAAPDTSDAREQEAA